MKQLTLLIIGTLILIGGFSKAYGSSGGWVGNAPLASYTPQIAFQSYHTDENAGKEWNSILLPEGQSRFGIRYNFCDTCSYGKTYWTLGYNYGFTSKLTMLDLLTFGYSLKSGNGAGSEWAIIFGLTDGLLVSSVSGTSVGPGVGIAYAYSESDWRFDFSTILSGYYNVNNSFWRNQKVSVNASLTKWLNDNWGAGLSTSYLYRSDYSKTISCGPTCTSTEEVPGYNDFTDPKVYGLLRLNEVHEFELGYRHSLANDRSITSLGYSYKW